jgi:oligo-1,6-glucosidase
MTVLHKSAAGRGLRLMKKTWWKESVVYQIYPRSFADSNGDGIGDLAGITGKLDYLKELGIDVIWLSPVYQSPEADNGYDISDYRAINPKFGTMEDFDRLLSEAHARGIRIVMDLVVNHTSDEHAWFVESRKSRTNPKRDYYIWHDPVDGHEPNNWGSCFSGPAWQYDETTGQYYLHLFHKKQPDLNWANPAVRDAVFDMMDWWCRKGIDGFRMDVISLISKPDGLPDFPTDGGLYGGWYHCANGPHVHEYLQEMNRRVLSKYDLMTVGECSATTIETSKQYANSEGTELSMTFSFDHMGLDGGKDYKWSTKRIPLVPLKKVMSDWQTGLDGKAWNSLFYCNHDQPRIVDRLGSTDPKYRAVSAKCIATSLHLMQGTPYIYEGEELGMTNYPFRSIDEFRDVESINAFKELTEKTGISMEELFPKIAAKSRDNARTPMQWNAGPGAGFTTGTPWIGINPNYTEINVESELKDPDSVFHYYQKLIRLRHESELICYGHFELLLPDDPDLFVYRRYLEDGRELLTVCNFAEHGRTLEIPERFRDGRVLIQDIPGHDVKDGTLKPYEAYVIEKV